MRATYGIIRHVLIVLVLGFAFGCGASEDKTAEKKPVNWDEKKQTTFGRAVQRAHHAGASRSDIANPRMGACVVCDQPVDYQHFAVVRGKNYAFDSDACAERFQLEPQVYLARY